MAEEDFLSLLGKLNSETNSFCKSPAVKFLLSVLQDTRWHTSLSGCCDKISRTKEVLNRISVYSQRSHCVIRHQKHGDVHAG